MIEVFIDSYNEYNRFFILNEQSKKVLCSTNIEDESS